MNIIFSRMADYMAIVVNYTYLECLSISQDGKNEVEYRKRPKEYLYD